MSLLYSNFPPLKTDRNSYTELFHQLMKKSEELNIATGYISSDSAIDLKNIIELNGGPHLNLCVGMHYFEGLSNIQKTSLESLNSMLIARQLGRVFFVVTFPFHGKLASFKSNNTPVRSIVGSSNLSNIVFGQRQYEVDYLISDPSDAIELDGFISQLIEKGSTPFEELDIRIVEPQNPLLNDQYGVKQLPKIEKESYQHQLSELSFTIPLKADEAPRSNLNTFFGEGRRNPQGFVMPRPWYEVELIVSHEITSQPGYPQADNEGEGGVFDVITDDGWSFKCKVSGDGSKNLRSEGDLKILGKWLKGRLENAGVLEPGKLVTDETLERYGRNTLSLTKIKDSDKWFLDFGVNK